MLTTSIEHQNYQSMCLFTLVFQEKVRNFYEAVKESKHERQVKPFTASQGSVKVLS
jgi:hypothetical protein